MAPKRGLVRFTLTDGAPTLTCRRGETTVAEPFGRWMLERVASATLDWPAVAFHRVEVTPRTLEVLLIAGDHAPAGIQFEAVAHALARELDVATRRRWPLSGALWAAIEVVVEPAMRSPRSAPSLRSR